MGLADNPEATSPPPKGKSRNKYYAVTQGKTLGIFTTWNDCQQMTHGFTGAKFKGFKTFDRAVGFMTTGGLAYHGIRIFPGDHTSECRNIAQYCAEMKVTLPAENNHIVCMVSTTLPAENNQTVSMVSRPTTLRERIPVYTDGACVHNGTSRAQGGCGVFWGEDHPHNLAVPLPHGDVGLHVAPTNNRAELYVAVLAVHTARTKNIQFLQIFSDSEYVVNCSTSYLPIWIQEGSLKTRPNHDLWELLHTLTKDMDIQWMHVKGHSDNSGNNEADKLANLGATKPQIECIIISGDLPENTADI